MIQHITLYNWEKVHSEFLDAKKEGSERNLLYWEKAGKEGLWDETEYNEQGKLLSKRSLNSTVWIFNMKNRHRWRDNKDVNMQAHVIDETELEKEKIRKLSTPELLKLIKENEIQ